MSDPVAASLLVGIDWRWPVSRSYDLGMSEFIEDAAFKESKSRTWSGRGKENAWPPSLKKTRAKCSSTRSTFEVSSPGSKTDIIRSDGGKGLELMGGRG